MLTQHLVYAFAITACEVGLLKGLMIGCVLMLARRYTALTSAYLTAVWTTFPSVQESYQASFIPMSAPWTAVFKPSSASVGISMPKIDPSLV